MKTPADVPFPVRSGRATTSSANSTSELATGEAGGTAQPSSLKVCVSVDPNMAVGGRWATMASKMDNLAVSPGSKSGSVKSELSGAPNKQSLLGMTSEDEDADSESTSLLILGALRLGSLSAPSSKRGGPLAPNRSGWGTNPATKGGLANFRCLATGWSPTSKDGRSRADGTTKVPCDVDRTVVKACRGWHVRLVTKGGARLDLFTLGHPACETNGRVMGDKQG